MTSPSTAKLLQTVVAETLPAGVDFQLFKEPVGIGDLYILRVITPAWKTRRLMERSSRMQNAVLPQLPPAERDMIFRISVVTPEEWREIRKDKGGHAPIKIIGKAARSARGGFSVVS